MMNGFNFSSNGRSLEVVLPMCLNQIYSEEMKDSLKVGSTFERVVRGLVLFSLQTKNECILLHDFAKILELGKGEVLDNLSIAHPSKKSKVLSIVSAVCCELVELSRYQIGSDQQQDYFSPNMSDLEFTLYAYRLASHVLEFQMETEYKRLGWEA